jgi:hypothetical protein
MIIGEALGISDKAVEFWRLTNFLFSSDKERIRLITEMKDKPRREIDNYVNEMRSAKLKDNQFLSLEEFLESFNKSKNMALERLFQQPLTPGMLSLFNGDPVKLFKIHSRKPGVWYMELLIYL